MTHVEQRATLADLYQSTGKAELVGGTIVELMPTGRKPNRVAFRIARSLDDFAQETGKGEAYTDNMVRAGASKWIGYSGRPQSHLVL